MPAQHTVKVIPWDDREFVAAYEQAAADVVAQGMRLEESRAELAIQRALRGAGYPNATLACERLVGDGFGLRTRCIVSRDGLTTQLAPS